MSPSPSASASSPPAPLGRRAVLLIVALISAFAALRFAALFGDLWLDEIWTLKKLRGFSSAAQIFTDFREANNHPLSSLWLYLWAPAKADWVYRLLSFASGVATLGLAAAIVANRTRHVDPAATPTRIAVAAAVSVVLLGACYLLIVYASEARGYAPALAFTLLGYLILLRTQALVAPARSALYALSCLLALLSHAAAMQVILAAVVWSAAFSLANREGFRRLLLRLAVWHALPLALCGVYAVHFLWGINVGGAPEINRYTMLCELVAYTVGLPSTRIAAFLVPPALIALLVALYRLGRRSLPDALFCGLLVVSPFACALIVGDSTVLFARYFIFSVAWSLLLVAVNLATLRRRPAWVVACLLIGASLVGNAHHFLSLLRHGRGEYQAALRYVAGQTPTGEITLCGDHDYRTFMVIEYYGRRVAPGRIVRYLAANHNTGLSPRWLLVHRLDGYPVPDPELFDDRGNTFTLQRIFPHAPLSGWDWYVYRNRNFP